MHFTLKTYKIIYKDLSEVELNAVFEVLDQDGNGSLSIDEIVRAIIGEMNEGRIALVKLAFAKMDKNGGKKPFLIKLNIN